jgi:two-component system LytT family sensor kinase
MLRMKRATITALVVLAISIMAYIVRWASGQFDTEFNTILFFTGLLLLTLAWEGMRLINIYLNKVFPFERSIPARIALQLGLGTVLAVFVRFLIYKFGEQYLSFRLDNLFRAATWILYVMGMAGINSIFFTRYFMDRWKDSHVMAERLEKEKAQVQFDNLKNQLNPHFLFNALTSLNSLIGENPSLASQFLQHMSKVYRYVLQNKEQNFVSLRIEFEFIQNYVFLAKTRFAEGLMIKFNISDRSWEKAIVPVTLQILIENALKHNVVDQLRPLTIEIFTTGDSLTVSNTLQPRKIVESSNKQGLDNLKSLYRFLTDRPVEVNEDGNRFMVKIPLL